MSLAGKRNHRFQGLVLQVLFVLCWAAPLTADVVLLFNGDRLTGDVQGLKTAKLSLKTRYAGTVNIDWSEVKSLDTEGFFQVRAESGVRYSGTIRSGEEGIEVVGEETIPVNRVDVVEMTPTKDGKPPGFWQTLQGSVDLGYTFNRGNSRLNQSSVAVTSSYQQEKYRLSGSVTSLFSRQDESDPTNRQTADARYDRYINSRRFSFLLGGFERDDRQKLDLRSRAGAGLGLTLIQSKKTELSLLGGMTFINEQFRLEPDELPSLVGPSSAEALAGIEYRTTWIQGIDVTSKLSFLPNVLAQRGRFRLEYDGTLRVPLVNNFNWNLTLFNRFDSSPPRENVQRNDYGIVSALGYSF